MPSRTCLAELEPTVRAGLGVGEEATGCTPLGAEVSGRRTPLRTGDWTLSHGWPPFVRKRLRGYLCRLEQLHSVVHGQALPNSLRRPTPKIFNDPIKS